MWCLGIMCNYGMGFSDDDKWGRLLLLESSYTLDDLKNNGF